MTDHQRIKRVTISWFWIVDDSHIVNRLLNIDHQRLVHHGLGRGWRMIHHTTNGLGRIMAVTMVFLDFTLGADGW